MARDAFNRAFDLYVKGMYRNMPKDHQLGDAPIENKYREQMNNLARFIDLYFNGPARGPARETGFVLLVFPFGDDPKDRCNYISNGADRKDIVNLMKAQIKRFEGQPEVQGKA